MRFLFVAGLLLIGWKACPTAVCGLPSTVHRSLTAKGSIIMQNAIVSLAGKGPGMPYQLECADCHHRYRRSYLSLSQRCPRCRSSDVIFISPSRRVGQFILGGGVGLFVLFLGDLCRLSGGGPGNTLLGALISLFFGENALAYYLSSLLLAIGIALMIMTGFNIAFGKHPAGE